jgi:hypothetical protein
MREFIRNHKYSMACCIVAALIAVSWLWSFTASARGRVAAHIDMRRGRYQLLGYGLPSPTRPEYARCLRERYGIQFHAVTGCIVSESLVSYVNAYDSTLEEDARRRFGRNVFDECANDADAKWKAQREAAAQNAEVRQ